MLSIIFDVSFIWAFMYLILHLTPKRLLVLMALILTAIMSSNFMIAQYIAVGISLSVIFYVLIDVLRQHLNLQRQQAALIQEIKQVRKQNPAKLMSIDEMLEKIRKSV